MWETGKNRAVIDETAENGVKFIPIVEWKEIGDKDTQIQYRGFVDDGFPEGKGVMTFPEGQKYVGEFKDGERWNGTEYDKDGKIIKEYVNGVKQ